MGIKTSIGWTDSSLQLMAGCTGCELWTRKATGKGSIRTCYAGIMVGRYGGNKGWPDSFDKPKLFPERLEKALKWKDLTNTDRPNKPWLNGLPRTIFLNDMGDTFTESLPIDWMLPHIELMESSPHIFQFLTKRPKRMATFFNDIVGYVPDNFWLGTSVTSQATVGRIEHLNNVPAKTKFLSVEPILERIELTNCDSIDQIIIGGESGFAGARPTNLDWISHIIEQYIDVAIFVKQLGSRPYLIRGSHLLEETDKTVQIVHGDKMGQCSYPITDSKGENLSDYPESLRRREMPSVETNWTLF